MRFSEKSHFSDSSLPAHGLGLEQALSHHFDQTALEDLAACSEWKAVQLQEKFRHVVFRQALVIEMLEQLQRRELGIRARNDGKTDALAQPLVGDWESGCLRYTHMAHGVILDAHGIDVVAASDNHILLPAGDLQVPLLRPGARGRRS